MPVWAFFVVMRKYYDEQTSILCHFDLTTDSAGNLFNYFKNDGAVIGTQT